MADTARIRPRPTTLDEFLVWEEAQRDKHEFRNGQIRMMTGSTLRNNTIALNIAFALREKLRGAPCRAYAYGRVALREVNAGYYPDVVVDCGEYEGKALAATKPTVVFEVLSPSTRNFDFSEKLPDYRDTEGIVQIVLVEPGEPRLHVWTNTGEAWRQSEIGVDQNRLGLPSLGVELTFAEIYDSVFD